MPLHKKNTKTKKIIIAAVILVLIILMIVSFPAPEHLTEIVLFS
jgi:hypothetical protein